MHHAVCARIRELHAVAPDSIGDRMDFSLIDCSEDGTEYLFRCRTEEWMRNAAGTLHGGIYTAVADQAMGFVVYCIKPGEGIAPTVQMQMAYHRPLLPQKPLLVRVRIVSPGRTLMHLSAQIYHEDQPEKLCITASGIYCYKPAESLHGN